jgi:hypothetical protein
MKYYKTSGNAIYAFESDGSQDHLIREDMISVTEVEANAILGQPLAKEQRIAALQAAYETDRDKLNKAWLSALIADGVEETARKAAIEAQMSDLDAQLEADILAIIMEE